MPTIAETFRLNAPKAWAGKDGIVDVPYKIDSKHLVGIEVEVENALGIGARRSMWQVKDDGSLRNVGREFVTLPIKACDAPGALHSLMTETLQQDCCFSPRTSVHIHLDCTSLPTETVVDMVLLYSVFERLWYKFVGKQRIKNIYCVPITETRLLRVLGTHGLMPTVWQKYAGLNLKPLGEYGTLEFRHMHGTADVAKLSIWIDLICCLKNYCMTTPTAVIRKMIAEMDSNFDYRGLLVNIFGDKADYLKYDSYNDVKYTMLTTKLALTRKAAANSIQARVSGESPFFKFKGAQ